MKTVGAAVIGAALWLPSAAAQDLGSANKIMEGCRAFVWNQPPSQFLQGECYGTVTGIAFASAQVCFPPAVTNGQLVRVVTAWIDARPQRLHEPFRSLAFEALRAAWPCS